MKIEKQTYLGMFREWIGIVAYGVFLWAFKMTAEEHQSDIIEDARREYESERRNAYLQR